jgi:hypothetical protein
MKSNVLYAIISAALVCLVSANCFAQEAGTRGRRVASAPAAEATVAVTDQFLNSFLTAIFDNLKEPSMPLTIAGATSNAECASEIRLKREVNGVRTAVHFENGHIVGPLAFSGAYNASLMGCIEFSGWADSEVTLEYDNSRRAVVARFRVRDIHLNNAPAVLTGPLLGMVQGTIDRKYNPVELFTIEKLSTRVDIQPAGGALRLEATDVRVEVAANVVTLHIFYQFVRG